MKVSKQFLNDYIDIKDKDFTEIANKMVFLGNEYDSFKKISEATKVVIGKVISKEKHPQADNLSVCMVDIGDQENYQIVCGAPNVDLNQKVIVAKVGAKLSEDIIIKKTKIRNVESNGMICSLVELGIEKKFLTQADLLGIHVLPVDAPLGKDAISYLGYNDEVITFDLTPDRGDLLSMLGMAYEIGSLYDLEIKYPPIEVEEIGEDINNDHKLEVETSNCFQFFIKRVDDVIIKESPTFIKQRLMASGIRPINNVVDISNYVMLETGQPLHFYDADKLGKHILVRMANSKETVVTIDKKTRILTKDDIVITDGIKTVGLAGVMGGLDTEVTENTKNIIVEGAIFDPIKIRNTSKKTIRSEASLRYEKGIDKEITVFAIKRACYLLNKYASGEVNPGILFYDSNPKQTKKIKITLNHINTILGAALTVDEVRSVFDKLKFEYIIDNLEFIVFIPSRRLDLNIKEDLIEEVGRIIGYDNIKGKLPILPIKEGSISEKRRLEKAIHRRLQSLGLNEVITYSLIGKEESEMFINEPKELVELNDPISIDKSILRNSLIPSLLKVYNHNKARKIDDINIFEIGSRYYKEKDNYIEINTLAGLLSGIYCENKWQGKSFNNDFYLLKGIIENLFLFLGFNNRYQFIPKSLKDMHPKRGAIIKIDQEIIGFLGEVHPNHCQEPTYVFEVDLEKILDLKIRPIKFKELNKYPTINRDIAFIVDKHIQSKDIIKVIKKAGGRLLTKVDVFDVYEGINLEEGKKSIAYSLVFSDLTRTLTLEEVNLLFEKIIIMVEGKIGAKLRDKRE